MIFGSDREGGYGALDLWETTRGSIDDPWSEPVNLGPQVNSDQNEFQATMAADELALILTRAPAEDADADNRFYLSTRVSRSKPWSEPTPLGSDVILEQYAVRNPCLSVDGMELYYNRRGATGRSLLTVSRRESSTGRWMEPIDLEPPPDVNMSEHDPCLSSDGLSLLTCLFGEEETKLPDENPRLSRRRLVGSGGC